MNTIQFEAVLWAMFAVENEIDNLEEIIRSTEDKSMVEFLEKHLEKRQEHFEAFKTLIQEGIKTI